MMKFIRFVYSFKMTIAWILALLAVVVIGTLFKGQSFMFTGIAEATETIVSVQNSVNVIKIHVTPGEEVKPGDTLVELDRPDLVLRINELTGELDALEGRGNVNTASIDQKVAEVQADYSARRNTIVLEIDKLKAQYQQNLELTSKLKSISASGLPSDSNDAMTLRIRGLEKELKVLDESANAQIRVLHGSKGIQKTSSATEASAIRREMDMLLQEKKDLTIIAKDSWIIASVDAHDGEKVSSFNPVLTLARKSPTMVRGYINEKIYTSVGVGDMVEITSQVNGQKIPGKIVGMSSRIVPFPVRLLKTPEMPMYGREVMIRLPQDNDLLLGEKVSIAEMPGWKKLLHGDKQQVKANGKVITTAQLESAAQEFGENSK
ncbi:MAG: HlyD family efflux transporter periplasmic adaptor subunit [Fibrobacteraceae bacterium]